MPDEKNIVKDLEELLDAIYNADVHGDDYKILDSTVKGLIKKCHATPTVEEMIKEIGDVPIDGDFVEVVSIDYDIAGYHVAAILNSGYQKCTASTSLRTALIELLEKVNNG